MEHAFQGFLKACDYLLFYCRSYCVLYYERLVTGIPVPGHFKMVDFCLGYGWCHVGNRYYGQFSGDKGSQGQPGKKFTHRVVS